MSGMQNRMNGKETEKLCVKTIQIFLFTDTFKDQTPPTHPWPSIPRIIFCLFIVYGFFWLHDLHLKFPQIFTCIMSLKVSTSIRNTFCNLQWRIFTKISAEDFPQFFSFGGAAQREKQKQKKPRGRYFFLTFHKTTQNFNFETFTENFDTFWSFEFSTILKRKKAENGKSFRSPKRNFLQWLFLNWNERRDLFLFLFIFCFTLIKKLKVCELLLWNLTVFQTRFVKKLIVDFYKLSQMQNSRQKARYLRNWFWKFWARNFIGIILKDALWASPWFQLKIWSKYSETCRKIEI